MLLAEINSLLSKAEEVLKTAEASSTNPKFVEEARLLLLGREGHFKRLFALLKDVEQANKPEIAGKINTLRKKVDSFFNEAELSAKNQKISSELSSTKIDITYPGTSVGRGGYHPLTKLALEVFDVLRLLGFEYREGPEQETEYFCFDSLNIPKHHPARDMQDTFYTDKDFVLRTHTSSIQGRELKNSKPPIKIVTFGRAYRNEAVDATHTEMFHQFEALWIDEGLTLSVLLDLMTNLLKALYGKRRKVKFVPKYYPYTEPSIGALIDDPDSPGSWVTVAGAGMVHRNVLLEFNVDNRKYRGLAFGFGLSRLAAKRYGYPDLRAMYQGNLSSLYKLV
jgi:phenylalanyl-tRNA synthetase alpha chain